MNNCFLHNVTLKLNKASHKNFNLNIFSHQVTASSAINHPNQYFDESRQSLQEGQGGASRLGSTTQSGLEHGKISVKNEINTTTNADDTSNAPVNTDTNDDLADIQMDDDDDDILGEIEGMDTMA